METRLHTQAPAAPPPSLTPAGGGLLRGRGTSGSLAEASAGNVKERLSAQRSTGVSQFDAGNSNRVPPSVQDIVPSPGQPLDAKARAFFEPRFGHDFSKVRVHTDSSASESADKLNALAFTTGPHIVFGSGQYAPETPRGRFVLAHELAHTLQPASQPFAIHRIPKDPQGAPFEGEIIPWSAALHESARSSAKVLADLPRGQRVTVQGGHAWILVETTVDGNRLTGYVSHELIRQVSAPKTPEQPAEKAADTVAKEVAGSPKDQSAPPAEEKADPDSPKLTQLKEMLGRYNVPEGEVIVLMGRLTPGEVAIVASDSSYKEKAVAALSQTEILQALNAMKLTGPLRYNWMKAAGMTVFGVVVQPEYKDSLEGVSLNPELVQKVSELCQYVIDNNYATANLSYSEGMRSPAQAHQWSTAYYIRQGAITQDRLEALPGGKDQDGNLWWKQGWTMTEAKANANSIWSGAKAYEGYAPGDPKRLPNLDATERSQHCFGEALDVKIRWRHGDGWHAEANNLVTRLGLTRPVAGEHWHFERDRGK